jgi:hypothetical protein
VYGSFSLQDDRGEIAAAGFGLAEGETKSSGGEVGFSVSAVLLVTTQYFALKIISFAKLKLPTFVVKP